MLDFTRENKYVLRKSVVCVSRLLGTDGRSSRMNYGIALLCLLAGCSSSTTISHIHKPPSEWDRIDCDIIIKSSMAHNVYDQQGTIRVFATPYYPSVVMALSKKQQLLKRMSEKEFRKTFDDLARESLGLYYDWYSSAYFDARGNYLRNRLQIDSLLFLVTIENKRYPCAIPFRFVENSPILNILDWPCYTPVLGDLRERIVLGNDSNEFIQPKFVWGKKSEQLMKEETLFVMFLLHQDSHHFLEGTKNLYLIVKGFGDDIKLTFPVVLIR